MSTGRKTRQGIFTPLFPEKYKGNVKNIVYRSSWESIAMSRFDRDVRIAKWSSEEMCIEYYNPVKQRIARYFPDFLIEVKLPGGVGGTRTIMIEVKPDSECKPPKVPQNKNAKRRERYITECATFAVNQSKWDAARDYCSRKGWTFQIMTEYELGLKKRPSSS